MAQYYATILADSPTAYYRLGESTGSTAYDESANAYNGTINGGVTKGLFGAITRDPNTAMSFDGSTGYITLPAALNGNGFTAVSLECWAKINTVSALSTYGEIFTGDATGVAGGFKGYELYWAGTTVLTFSVGNGTTSTTAGYTTTAVAGSWWHIIGTYDGSNIKIYVNGVLQATTPFSGTIVASSVPVVGANVGHGSLFPGVIDEISVYKNVALSQAQVTAHYNAGLNNGLGRVQYLPTIFSDTPTAYYRLGETLGTTARDEMANAYNGTITGGVTLGKPSAIANDPNGSMLFNGSTGFIALSTAVNGNGLSALSVEGWFKLSTISLGSFTDLLQTGSGSIQGYALYWSGTSSINFSIGNGTTSGLAQYNVSPVAGPWWHVCGTYDGTTVKIYVNGVLRATVSAALGAISNATAVGIGAVNGGSSSFFPGTIDEVAIYNYALSATQVTAHYTTGVSNGVGPYNIYISSMLAPVLAGTLKIDNAVGRRSQAGFSVHTDSGTHYQQYQRARIYDQYSALAFSGYLTDPKEQKPGFQNSLIHSIACADQHYLADKRMVSATYTNRSPGYIAQDILTNILSAEGVTLGSIVDAAATTNLFPQATSLFPQATTLFPQATTGILPTTAYTYISVAQVLDSLVKFSSYAGLTYYWVIDQYKQFYMVPYTTTTNPNVVDGSVIDITKSPTVSRKNPTYRNQQIVIGGFAQTSSQTETKLGDGNATAWTMGYALAAIPTISTNLNGAGYVAKAVGVLGVDTGKDFYWQQGSPVITQDSAGTRLRGPTGTIDLLKVVYTGQYPSTVVVQNAGQVAQQAALDGTSGIIEQTTTDPTLGTVANAQTLASSLLARYAVQGIILQFSTRQSGYAPGQLITVNLPMHNLTGVQMLVENVSIADSDGTNIWYTVTAISGPTDMNWVSFFGTLLASPLTPASINIQHN